MVKDRTNIERLFGVEESDGVDKDLFVDVKPQWGKDVLYPACENSRLLVRLSNAKTVTPENKKILEQMGFVFNYNAKYYSSK
jgi:hypothetical protein